MIQLTRTAIKFLSSSTLLVLGVCSAVAAPSSGFYADLALGTAHMNSPSHFNNTATSGDLEIPFFDLGSRYSPAGNIGVGYHYTLSPRSTIGTELSYSYLGNAYYEYASIGVNTGSGGSINLYQNSINLLGSYQFTFSNHWFTQVKLGMAYVTQTADTNSIGYLTDDGNFVRLQGYTIHKIKPLTQISLGDQVSKNMLFSLMYQHLFGIQTDNQDGQQLLKNNAKIYSNDAFFAQFSYLF